MIEWAAFAYQAVSEAARVRSTPRSNATATLDASCWVSETAANAACHALQSVDDPEGRVAPASVALCPSQNGFLSALQLRLNIVAFEEGGDATGLPDPDPKTLPCNSKKAPALQLRLGYKILCPFFSLD